MLPSLKRFEKEESGIKRVVEAYTKYLPNYGIQIADEDETSFDLRAVHAGMTAGDCEVAHLHGLYWGDNLDMWQLKANANIVEAIKSAKQVTVPSAWVAETFQRDMRYTPNIVPHGIEWQDWQHKEQSQGYVLWNKNRIGDVCTPEAVSHLAQLFNKIQFKTTFLERSASRNIETIGLVPHQEMKLLVQRAGIYLSTAKETFGIGALEAMASGVPVLGWDYGGNRNLIEHGVTGYLAEPGNYEDLAKGLDYCFQHGNILGANGREVSRKYTWEYACELVANIYEKALQVENPTVSVVIPVHDKAPDEIQRAIDSVNTQSYQASDIIVILDKCDSSLLEVYKSTLTGYSHLIEVNYGRVAQARNSGIDIAISKYICCLDADDWIAPNFLEACVNELENDKTLGIAYTGLMTHLPDGTEQLSHWPVEFDYDKQINYTARMNHVPTCCVFRRDVWERIGGYKSRYCPKGAGSEDAAFWAMFGALGYGAKKVSNEGLFHYTAFSGNVSGNSDYKELDWLAWYPWSKNNNHPFASIATPINNVAHIVREYDEPLISIIIPVGPGHEDKVIDALDSIEAQTFRQWEVILVDDTDNAITKELSEVLISYPYVKRTFTQYDINRKSMGAGYARNRGVEIARAPFILFLDADDMFNVNHPEALDKMLQVWNKEGNGVYSDYIGRSYDNIDELSPSLKKRIIHVDDDGEVFTHRHAQDYNCEMATKEPSKKFYIWNIISTLIPKQWHLDIGGFDESMETWEDWDYWLKMAKDGKCFTRVEETYFVYKYYTGTRSNKVLEENDSGLQTWENVLKYLIAKHNELEIKMCNCKGKKVAVQTQQAVTMAEASDFNSEDFELVVYNHPNIGAHLVTGYNTGIKYGRRKGKGTQQFRVHKEDIAGQPHIFSIVGQVKVVDVPAKVTEPPKPLPDTKPLPDITIDTTDGIQGKELKQAQSVIEQYNDENAEQEGHPLLTPAERKTFKEATKQLDLQALPGVTPRIAESMIAAELTTEEAILEAGVKGLTKIKFVAETRAELIIHYLSK